MQTAAGGPTSGAGSVDGKDRPGESGALASSRKKKIHAIVSGAPFLQSDMALSVAEAERAHQIFFDGTQACGANRNGL